MGLWQRALAQVAAHASAQGAHLARTVVLVPYAQLMPWAQRHWALQFPQGFAPRFETTRNWARQLQVFEPSADDFAGDVARDTLTARALLDRVGQGAQREMLATPLQEAAAQLAPVVAAFVAGAVTVAVTLAGSATTGILAGMIAGALSGLARRAR